VHADAGKGRKTRWGRRRRPQQLRDATELEYYYYSMMENISLLFSL
jgi:hypothetical protein